MNHEKYLVVIVGYEGIEMVFGPFAKSDALELALSLKAKSERRNSHYKAAQVCIMKSPRLNRPIECVCRTVPGLPAQEEWLY